MISLASEPIFHIGSFPVTNTILNTLLVDALIIGLVISIKKNISKIPGTLQNIAEFIIEGFYNLTESVAPGRAKNIFPYFASFFLFILLANWTGLIPGVGTVGFFEEGKLVPILRSSTSDMNTTFGLAIVSLIATHILSIQTIGVKEYLNRYFSLNPINLFVGLLEIVGEITKVISLSFRLFGNILAGEVVLATVAGIFAFVFPLPFLLLEVIVGLVQALVFSMLTMAFMAILTTPHHREANHH